MKGETVTVAETFQGVTREAIYREDSWREGGKPFWVLTHWRVTVGGEAGKWHKVHGNQRRDVIGFPTLRDEHPIPSRRSYNQVEV